MADIACHKYLTENIKEIQKFQKKINSMHRLVCMVFAIVGHSNVFWDSWAETSDDQKE